MPDTVFYLVILIILVAVRSREKWQAGDAKWARRYGCIALLMSLLALISILIIVLFVLKAQDVIDW